MKTDNRIRAARAQSARSAFPLFHFSTPLARRSRASGFTLIELLLVIAVIGILSGLLFSGVFGVTRRANEKRNENNRKLLLAAIMEYRHDVGKWPIPDEDAASSKARTESYDNGTSTQHKKVVWTLTYGKTDADGKILEPGDNSVVVEHLLTGKVGSKATRKDYLDLRTFMTVPEGDLRERYPKDTVSAHDEHLHGTTARRHGKDLPLVYRAQFVKCPVCETLQTAAGIESNKGFCKNSLGCHDTDAYPEEGENAPPHSFSKTELSSRLVDGSMPYKITFDFINNTCSISY